MAATITSITGLQNLTNLTEFLADFNSLTTVDISGMSSLTNVDISDNNIIGGEGENSLTSVNVTGCTNITALRLDDSNFATVNSIVGLSDLTSCQIIDLDQCGIAGTVDLSALTNLQSIDVFDNNISNLIIPNEPSALTFISANANNFSQTSVNNILINLDNGGATTGDATMEDGSPSPTGAGITAASNLTGKGWNLQLSTAPGLTQRNNRYDLANTSSICNDTATLQTFWASGSLGIGTEAFLYNWGGIPTLDGWYQPNDGLDFTLYFVTGGVITITGSCL